MCGELRGGPTESAPGAPGAVAGGRIREALMVLVLEVGFDRLTAADVSAHAGVPLEEFERAFPRLEDCYTWVHEQNVGEFERLLGAAFEREGAWRDRLRAAAYVAARYMEAHPREVRFGVTEMFTAGPVAQAFRERGLQRMVDLIDAGREELDDPASVDRGVAEGVFGAIYATLTAQLRRREGPLPAAEFVPAMMYLAVGPYLGQAAAREELARAPADRVRYERGEI